MDQSSCIAIFSVVQIALMEKQTFVKKNMWVEKKVWERFTTIAERLGMKQWGLLKNMVDHKEEELNAPRKDSKRDGNAD